MAYYTAVSKNWIVTAFKSSCLQVTYLTYLIDLIYRLYYVESGDDSISVSDYSTHLKFRPSLPLGVLSSLHLHCFTVTLVIMHRPFSYATEPAHTRHCSSLQAQAALEASVGLACHGLGRRWARRNNNWEILFKLFVYHQSNSKHWTKTTLFSSTVFVGFGAKVIY